MLVDLLEFAINIAILGLAIAAITWIGEVLG